MTGEPENNRCHFCRGRVESRLATLPFAIRDSVVVVKRVPAEVCTQCGEATVSSQVARQLDVLLKQVHRLHSEISVITYSESLPQAA